ncbi:hypothetical protein [Amycolatopsis plumensis]|uniref:Uncharacterized protein n=1 Tax=Amycolatopsis plumensis TaxID=236508 RepID=A0ABV5TZW1_9PSEU
MAKCKRRKHSSRPRQEMITPSGWPASRGAQNPREPSWLSMIARGALMEFGKAAVGRLLEWLLREDWQ